MFPTIHNGSKAEINNDKIKFSYITSLGEVITEIKSLLDSDQIKEKISERIERFISSGPGTRESESSRAERKWISAHPINILKETWNKLDEDEKMEMNMMLDMNSHYGISDEKWARKYSRKRNYIKGDDGEDLL